LLPETLLPCSVHGNVVRPHFLGEHDHPWLRVLLEEYMRFVGRHQRELDERLREPLPCATPTVKCRSAIHVLARHYGTRQVARIVPRRARAAVFIAAARSPAEPAVVLASVAATLGVTVTELTDALFADLPGERLVAPPVDVLSPGELALRTNLAIAQGFVFRSTALVIEMEGNARAVVRHAKWRGLICAVTPREAGRRTALEMSGPYALFRRTLVYGRALSEVLPLLAWCHRYRLQAHCVVRGRQLMLQLESGDPIFPGRAPQLYDSKLEERFARDFRRIAPGWDVIREPEPVRAGDMLIFPDFALQHRGDGRRWLVEIVGFWTREYVQRKLALLRLAELPKLVLCVDESRNCADGMLPRSSRVVLYRRRIDAAAVLRLIEQESPGLCWQGRKTTGAGGALDMKRG
jgi:predicted nuclease of restriction endonuclease-like RecB superfamily